MIQSLDVEMREKVLRKDQGERKCLNSDILAYKKVVISINVFFFIFFIFVREVQWRWSCPITMTEKVDKGLWTFLFIYFSFFSG